ncbi:MAG: CHAT domain-containing tetratricopeptide repeat protein [Cyanobacteria bacterium P01_G01_bin.54]
MSRRLKTGLLILFSCLLVLWSTPLLAQDRDARVTDAVYLNQEAYDLFRRGEAAAAIATYEQALEIFRETDAWAGEGNSLNGIGQVYLTRGEPETALDYFEQARRVFAQFEDDLAAAYSQRWIGRAQRDLRNIEAALQAYQQALDTFQAELRREPRDPTSLQTSIEISHTEMGALWFQQADYEAAIAAYQAALAIQAEQNDKIGRAYTLNNLGVVYANQSRYREALDAYNQALAIIRELKDAGIWHFGEEAAILNNLSALFLGLGDLGQALDTAQQAEAIYGRWQQEDNAKPLLELELLRDAIGQASLSSAAVQPTFAIRAPVGRPANDERRAGQALTLNNLAQLHQSQGNGSEAIQLYQQALQQYQDLENPAAAAMVLSNLGQVYGLQGEAQAAIAFTHQALVQYRQLNDPVGIALAQTNLAQIAQAQGDLTAAIAHYQDALAVQETIGDPATLAFTLRQLGALYLAQDKPARAIPVLRAAIAHLETLRVGLTDAQKVNVFERGKSAYGLLAQALVAQDQIEDALIITEQGRGRAFVELLADRAGLATLEPLTFKEMQAIAQAQQTVLVDYALVGDRDLYIWVLQPTGELTLRTVALAESTASDWRGYLTRNRRSLLRGERQAAASQVQRSPVWWALPAKSGLYGLGSGHNLESITALRPRQQQSLQTLYELLIAPIADLLPPDPQTNLVLIPQGELFLIPFAALLDKNGDPLVAQHPLRVVPSIQSLALTAEPPASSNPTALIVGNPTMPAIARDATQPPVPLIPLPGAEAEAQAIAHLLNTVALTGDQATETAIARQLPQAQIIHLATHGLLDEVRHWSTTPGAIALAPDPPINDGFLTPSEILSLQLKADLVVLSACDTGRGRLTGDGVVGLSRACLGAGAKSAIVSLWAVPDQPTAILMTEFYRQWQALGQMEGSKAIALQQAMLTVRSQFANPSDWAAFVLVGAA